MQLPARGRLAEEIGAIEPVRPVDADGTEGRDDAAADTGSAQQTGGVELAGARPHVAGVVERRDVEHLRHPGPHVAGPGAVALADRTATPLPAAGALVEPMRADLQPVVASQRH